MAEISFRELIDPRRLQHLQNEFCKVTGVAAVCLDSENQVVTEPYVDKTWKRLDGEDPISTEYRRKAAQALDRVQAGSLEEQVGDGRKYGYYSINPAFMRVTGFILP